MNRFTAIIGTLLLVGLFSAPVQAGLLNGAVKGVGKGTKAVVGCADRGVKGVGKGAKTVTGCAGKGAKSTVGGVGKATKTAL